MDKVEKFSYIEYLQIIKKFIPIIKDFNEINEQSSEYCLVRHDVDFSVERAVKIATIDNSCGINSSFFVQVLNNAYNPLSVNNTKLLKKISEFGHFIGLHFYVSHIKKGDKIKLKQELKRQVNILQECLDLKIDRFSFHRPPSWVLDIDTSDFTDLINVYSPQYFELIKEGFPKKIKYLADSNYRWIYGHPLDNHKYKCFQILIHPDLWSERGCSEFENFTNLISEAKDIFINNIDEEYKDFNQIGKFK
jgi:hypothetical protein